jgi:hypothetical protein
MRVIQYYAPLGRFFSYHYRCLSTPPQHSHAQQTEAAQALQAKEQEMVEMHALSFYHVALSIKLQVQDRVRITLCNTDLYEMVQAEEVPMTKWATFVRSTLNRSHCNPPPGC